MKKITWESETHVGALGEKKKDPGSALNPWSGTWESISLIVPQRQIPSPVWAGFLTSPHLRRNNRDGRPPGRELSYGEAHVQIC